MLIIIKVIKMANFVLTADGKKVALNRLLKVNPDYTAPIYFKVGTGQATPKTSDIDLTNPVVIDTDNVKEFVDGYPVINDSGFEATVRCFLETSEANGNAIDGIGIFNNDATKKAILLGKHLAIEKSEYNQVSYIIKVAIAEYDV